MVRTVLFWFIQPFHAYVWVSILTVSKWSKGAHSVYGLEHNLHDFISKTLSQLLVSVSQGLHQRTEQCTPFGLIVQTVWLSFHQCCSHLITGLKMSWQQDQYSIRQMLVTASYICILFIETITIFSPISGNDGWFSSMM